MIIGIFLELLGPGGVQRVGRHAASVLRSYAREHGLRCDIYSLRDPSGENRTAVGSHTLTFRGCGGSRAALLLHVLASLPRAKLSYCGHPNLAPLGLIHRLKPSARYVVETHGIDVWNPLPMHRRMALRLASAITAASTFTAQRIISVHRVDPRRVVPLPWTIDPEHARDDGSAHHCEAYVPPANAKLVLCVSRLTSADRYKGVERLITAFATVLCHFPAAHLLIIGDGPDRNRLEALVARESLAGHVTFLGHVSDSTLHRCYALCDVFVMPSKAEDFGVVFLEAMAHAKPVIGGNHCGTPDVIVDGETGFLVDHDDTDLLACRLIALLRDDSLRTAMGAAGRERVERRYTFAHYRTRLVQLLASVAPD